MASIFIFGCVDSVNIINNIWGILMDVQTITSLISGVGFPIVMCLMMFKYMQDEQANHKQESDTLKDAINELKVAITALTERINNLEDKTK